ncbi:hypothetical protein BPOR_0683g00030 [Botrytis porri]|uniref:Uncharacterized protein n=1 Tax=Botrytis porri TaxID=87229 RepID=A0A4Z1KAQ7_9HELO|nr:hypothetical protein BPOR_0683g00030 [Botrytis porri]
MNFIVYFIICFLASIAIADTHNVTLTRLVSISMVTSLICGLDDLSNDIDCLWTARSTQNPIFTQPTCKDFVFELESEGKFRQTDLEPLYVSAKSNIIEVNPLIVPADYTEMEKKLGSPFVAFSIKVNCMREYGPESILWCEL